jgi:hypothetical protein
MVMLRLYVVIPNTVDVGGGPIPKRRRVKVSRLEVQPNCITRKARLRGKQPSLQVDVDRQQ